MFNELRITHMKLISLKGYKTSHNTPLDFLKVISFFSLSLFLNACGGGETSAPEPELSSAPPPSTSTPATTDTLVVSASFDFRIDSTINLYMNELPDGPGVLHIYYKHAYYDADSGAYYPDYGTLVASWRPTMTSSLTIAFNKTWDGLVFAWVPETATGVELYKRYRKTDLTSDFYLSM